jgi:hypothetical protein
VCYHIDHMWRCIGFRHQTWKLARNLLNCCTQPLHVIARRPDKFRDFRTSSELSVIWKHFSRKLFVMSRQQDARHFMWVTGYSLNINQISWISFFESPNYMISCTCSSNLKCPKKFEKTKKLTKYTYKIQNWTKLEQIVLNNVARHQKTGEKN